MSVGSWFQACGPVVENALELNAVHDRVVSKRPYCAERRWHLPARSATGTTMSDKYSGACPWTIPCIKLHSLYVIRSACAQNIFFQHKRKQWTLMPLANSVLSNHWPRAVYLLLMHHFTSSMCNLKMNMFSVKRITNFQWFYFLSDFLSQCVRYPAWIDCCKRFNCDSAIVQSRRLSLFRHIARMPDETDAKQILTATSAGNWRRPLGRPRITWMKTIQQDLKSSDLNICDAVALP